MGLNFTGAAGAAGVISGALGKIQAGNAAASADNYNAVIADQNAEQELKNASLAAEVGNINAAMSEQHTREQVGGIKANQGASGVQIGTGSSGDVQASAAQTGMLDAMTIRTNAARAAYSHQIGSVDYKAKAQLDRAEGKYAKQAGRNQAITTVLGGIASGGQTGLFPNDPFKTYQAKNSLTGGKPEDDFLLDDSGH